MRKITAKFANSTSIELNKDVIAVFEFISSPDSVIKMIEATDNGKPALSGIVRELEERFGNCEGFPLNHNGPGKNAKNRRNVGWIVRFVMREYGYMPLADSERTRIGADSKSRYFGNAAVYEKMDSIADYEILSQAFVNIRKMELDDIFIGGDSDNYEFIYSSLIDMRRRKYKLSLSYEFIAEFLQHVGYGNLISTDDVKKIFDGAKVPCVELYETINNMMSLFESFNIKKEHGYHEIYGSSTDKALQAFYGLEIDPTTVNNVYVFFDEWDAKLFEYYNLEADEKKDALVGLDAPRMIIETNEQEYWFNGFTCGYGGQGCGGSQEVLLKLGILEKDEYPVNNEIQSYKILHYYKENGKWTYQGFKSYRKAYEEFDDTHEFLYRRNGQLVLTQAESVKKDKMYNVVEPKYEWLIASDYFMKQPKIIEFLSKEEAVETGHIDHWAGKEMVYQIILKDNAGKELWLTYPFEDILEEKRENFHRFLKHVGFDEKQMSSTPKSFLEKIVSSKKEVFGVYTLKGDTR
ncbi:MAG: hypothetical protein RR071_10535 [Lachnospiraceae bacterium]